MRTWTVRLLGDAKKVSPAIARPAGRAGAERDEPDGAQPAGLLGKRLPGKDCLPIVRELLRHNEDVDDPHIPLLLWWAVEDKAIRDRELVLGLLDSPEAWQVPLVRQYLVERLARRYMAEGGEADLRHLRPAAGGGAGAGRGEAAGARHGEGAGRAGGCRRCRRCWKSSWAICGRNRAAIRCWCASRLRLGSPQGYERSPGHRRRCRRRPTATASA